MKTLDKYVVKNFLTGYAIAFLVLMGLRIMIDLFVNIDEFTENIDMGTMAVLKNVVVYYSRQSVLYYRNFSGMITVVAAVFSLGKMTRDNELVAVMASGMSLKRLIAPIVFLSVFFTGLHVIDQEIIIPPMADKLVRSHDVIDQELSYDMWFISDGQGNLFCSPKFNVSESIMIDPTIITRKLRPDSIVWDVAGIIKADSAHYDFDTTSWILENGIFQSVSREVNGQSYRAVDAWVSDLTPKDIPVRRKSAHMDLLSSYDLVKLARQSPKDLARLYAQKNFRVTDPVINLVMLMISLPLLVCRDPKGMKSAIIISFALTSLCYILTFVCKIFAGETVFIERSLPELWAWLPVFVFLPIAFIEFDAMKT
ncbi:MAG: LptF/LptG family permease [Anaerohalosphaeraceae bacterium]|nr:LptF/LptG family permease [Anaerohalosphaeraceae bacterium]